MALIKKIKTDDKYGSAQEIEIYDTYVLATSKDYGSHAYEFDNFKSISFYPASFTEPKAFIVFNSKEKNYSNTEPDYFNDYFKNTFLFTIMICCGPFSSKKTTIVAKKVYDEINSAFLNKGKQLENKIKKLGLKRESYSFFKDFENKYNIAFDDFKKSLHFLVSGRGVSELRHQDKFSIYDKKTIYSFAWSDKYIVIIPEKNIEKDGLVGIYYEYSTKPLGIVLSRYEDEIFYENAELLSESFSTLVEPFIIPIEKLLYIEFTKNVKTYNFSPKKTSTLNLMMTEEIFGTAAAVGKCLDSQTNITDSYDFSGYHFVFTPDIDINFYFEKGVPQNHKDIALFINEHTYEVYKTRQAMLSFQKNNSNIIGSNSCVDEIRKFKSLYDDGIITKEEFEAKKSNFLDFKNFIYISTIFKFSNRDRQLYE